MFNLQNERQEMAILALCKQCARKRASVKSQAPTSAFGCLNRNSATSCPQPIQNAWEQARSRDASHSLPIRTPSVLICSKREARLYCDRR